MEDLPRTLLLIPLFVILASVVEAVVLSRRQPGSYDWRGMGISLLDLGGRIAIRILAPATLIVAFGDWLWERRIATVPLDTAGAVALLFVGQEFCYYWYHRAAHRVRWFWLTHSVHHSPNQLSLSAAYRLGWAGKTSGGILFFFPLIWLGFKPNVVFACLALNLLYQFWIHATWIPRLGWLEYFLNTPSAHRVHHAANLEYLDANYGGVLIVFDRLFGTYVAERDDLPCRYGWVKPIESYNPLRVEFTSWMSLWNDMRQAQSPWQALAYLWHPPGWHPSGKGETTAELRAAALASVGTTNS